MNSSCQGQRSLRYVDESERGKERGLIMEVEVRTRKRLRKSGSNLPAEWARSAMKEVRTSRVYKTRLHELYMYSDGRT